MLRASQIAEAQAAAGIRPSANGRDLMTARERELTKLRKEQGGGKAGPSGTSAAAGASGVSAAPKIKVKAVAKRPAEDDLDLGVAPASKKQKQGGAPERTAARAPARSDLPRGGPALNR